MSTTFNLKTAVASLVVIGVLVVYYSWQIKDINQRIKKTDISIEQANIELGRQTTKSTISSNEQTSTPQAMSYPAANTLIDQLGRYYDLDFSFKKQQDNNSIRTHYYTLSGHIFNVARVVQKIQAKKIANIALKAIKLDKNKAELVLSIEETLSP